MAAVTLSSTQEVQGIARVFVLSQVANGSTFALPTNGRVIGLINASNSTALGAATSAGVVTFKVASSTADVNLVVAL